LFVFQACKLAWLNEAGYVGSWHWQRPYYATSQHGSWHWQRPHYATSQHVTTLMMLNKHLPCAAAAAAGMSKLAPGEEASMEQVVTSAVPLGRMGDKADIALACVYLASSAGR
jgi:NAD(P)-dependent dehydrogenase (short-subunit alcohol dehydrogenase family)